MNFAEIEAILDEFIEKQENIDQKVVEIIWDLFYGLKEEYEDNEE